MRRLVDLYLPVLFPSWRFFEEIGAGPRVDYRLNDGDWIEATATPDRLPWPTQISRLFWNANGNERLYLVTLAERILTRSSDTAEAELAQRLALRHVGTGELTYRICLVDEAGEDVAFESRLHEF